MPALSEDMIRPYVGRTHRSPFTGDMFKLSFPGTQTGLDICFFGALWGSVLSLPVTYASSPQKPEFKTLFEGCVMIKFFKILF